MPNTDPSHGDRFSPYQAKINTVDRTTFTSAHTELSSLTEPHFLSSSSQSVPASTSTDPRLDAALCRIKEQDQLIKDIEAKYQAYVKTTNQKIEELQEELVRILRQ